MPDLDLAALKALAEKATKGKRSLQAASMSVHAPNGDCVAVFLSADRLPSKEQEANARLATACDPDTILALIALVEHYRYSEAIYQSRIRQLEPLEAEIESMKARRCENCASYRPLSDYQGHCSREVMQEASLGDGGVFDGGYVAPDFGCVQWGPKE